MGEIIKMTCKSCGRDWTCWTGCGKSHGLLESVLEVFPQEVQQQVKIQVGERKLPLFDFAYKAANCEKCCDIVSVPVLELRKEGLSYVGPCSQCKTEIQRAKVEEVQCPICAGRQFECVREGLWD